VPLHEANFTEIIALGLEDGGGDMLQISIAAISGGLIVQAPAIEDERPVYGPQLNRRCERKSSRLILSGVFTGKWTEDKDTMSDGHRNHAGARVKTRLV
jgi:hypothetical protein